MYNFVQGSRPDVSEHTLPRGDPQYAHVNQLSAEQVGKFDIGRAYNSDWTGHIFVFLIFGSC
jgi:hypothetical protein